MPVREPDTPSCEPDSHGLLGAAWAVMVKIARWTMCAFFTSLQLDIWRDKRSCANTLLAQTVANGITRSI